MKFHHFWPPLENFHGFLWKNLPEKKRGNLGPCGTLGSATYALHTLMKRFILLSVQFLAKL